MAICCLWSIKTLFQASMEFLMNIVKLSPKKYYHGNISKLNKKT